ncbi:ubiquitin-like domain-containing protein [Streptomyces sp. NPDC006678]|uniref:ubiquitin-like domain-containing protein n=2 Tax=unclassified Streptomyces TaxID=2593676 RepID=UPI0034049465
MEPPPPPVPPGPVQAPLRAPARARDSDVSPYAPTVAAFLPGPGPGPGTGPRTGPGPGRGPGPGPGRDTGPGPGPGRDTGPEAGPDGGPEAGADARREAGLAAGPEAGPAGGSGTGAPDPAVPAAPAPPPAGGRAEARRAARRRRTGPLSRSRPDSLRRLIPQALVVAFLAGGTTAFVAADKGVRLSVDGVPRTLHTFADDVGELLADEGLAVGEHDIVAPAPDADLDDGDEVVVRFGRPVTLTIDGHRRQVWTTARTVADALHQVGVRAEGAHLSASRSLSISRKGLDLDVRTERKVTFMADGREHTIRTNAATAQQAVEEAGITLGGRDTTSVPPGSFPRDGQTITVMRITDTEQVREEPIPYSTVRTEDPALHIGTEVVEQQGRTGTRQVTYALRTINGVRQKPRKVSEAVLRPPVTQRISVGTKPLPDSVAGADGLNWAALAQCESGGRPNAVDPSGTYGGLYQFDTRTWQSLGGSGRPQDAPAEEQTYRAKKLYLQRGASPWPHCGRRLYR